MEEEGLGFRFYARLAGIGIAVAIAGLIVMLILSRAIYAWGFFGMFLLLAVVLLVVGWLIDRREARQYEVE